MDSAREKIKVTAPARTFTQNSQRQPAISSAWLYNNADTTASRMQSANTTANLAHYDVDKGVISSSREYKADIFRLCDLIALTCGLVLAHQFRFENLLFTSSELLASLVFALIFSLTASSFGFYTHNKGRNFYSAAAVVLCTFLTTISILSIGLFFTHTSEAFSRLWFAVGSTSGVLLLLTYRLAVIQIVKFGWMEIPSKRVVIAGSGKLGHEVAHRLKQDIYNNTELVGYFSDEEDPYFKENEIAKLGNPKQIETKLEQIRLCGAPIDRVFIAIPANAIGEQLKLVSELVKTQYQVFVVPDYSIQYLNKCMPDNISGLPVLDMSHSPLHGPAASVKTIVDMFLAAIGCVLLIPLFIIVSILIKLDSKGPIIFKQQRYGLGGKEISVFKFRTMKDSDKEVKLVQATNGDKRVTNIGKFLRRSSIDELPQLFNVLNGTMSLVGPRPHAVAHNEMYRKLIGGYMRRHSVKPGITGWAQISGCRGETDTVDKMQERVDYDRAYLQRWSIGFDFYILFKTVKHVVRGDNAY